MNRAWQALTRVQWTMFWRDRQNVMWIVAFPLMFLVIFGFMFRDAGATTMKFVVTEPVPVLNAAMAQSDGQYIETKTVDSDTEAQEAVSNGEADAWVEANGDTLVVHYSTSDTVKAGMVQGIVGAMVDRANIEASGVQPEYALRMEPLSKDSVSPLESMAPGLLGWAIVMSAAMTAAMGLVQWRNSGVLRRLQLAPVKVSDIFIARSIVGIIIGLMQAAIFILVAKFLFGMHVSSSVWLAIPLVVAASLAFTAVGLIIGGISVSPEAASGLTNLIVVPMAFLSGAFVPLQLAPEWLSSAARFTPTFYLNQGLIDTIVGGASVDSILVPFGVTLLAGIVLYAVAFATFRWEPRR